MNTYIALLRGINVGGHKKILMADLRNLLENLKFKNIQTYIQSGNVVLQSDKKGAEIEKLIKKGIQDNYGFDVTIVVKTPQELQLIFDSCPFPEEKKSTSHFIMFQKRPKEDLITQANQISYPNEEFYIYSDCIYFFCSTGYGRTKFSSSFFDRKLNASSTGRNYKTMVKLIEMTS